MPMLPRSSIAFVPLLLALGAMDARAQSATSATQPFPHVGWGLDADSVIRVLGEPEVRKPISSGLEELDYLAEWEGRGGARYVLVHPALGTVIAGYSAPFESEAECHAQADYWLREFERDYPRLRWLEGDAPDADALCGGKLGASGAAAHDVESGTRVGIRLNRAGTALVADAISPAGYEWVGTTR